MDEDVDEITTVQGSWDDDDNNQESSHPITSLQTQEYDTYDSNRADLPQNTPNLPITTTHHNTTINPTSSDLKPRGRGFRRDH
jgi:hypothetical protein